MKILVPMVEEICDENFWRFYDLILEEEGSTKMMEEVEGVAGEYVLLYGEPTFREKRMDKHFVVTQIRTYDFCL